MFANLTALEDGAHADFCVIGSGPAGMTIARKLAQAGKKVFLCEGGGEEISEESQDIYKGKDISGEYFPLDTSRLRFLGGSSNHWGGSCINFEDYDFKAKKASPDGAWPINAQDLNPYKNEASETLDVKPVPKSVKLVMQGNDDLVIDKFSHGLYPIPQQEKYFEYLQTKQNLFVFLNSNLVKLLTDGEKILSATFANYQSESRKISADKFILATGGIENSRILLYNNIVNKGKLVKNPRTLGKYYMDHPLDITAGYVGSFDHNTEYGSPFELFSPQVKLLDLYKILSFTCIKRYQLKSLEFNRETAENLTTRLNRGLQKNSNGGITEDLFYTNLYVFPELEPILGNSVALGLETDRFGIPRVDLSIRVGELFYRTKKISSLILSKYMIEKNFGRVKLAQHILRDEPIELRWGNHHMGGTRMAENNEWGIVDKNCLVFGQKNLYIAGSSVFPSGGANTPTYTIVQLALRLADHLLALRA